jgi:putative toxin-antitoxin system antitoxin component (TIGR02293 family)
VAISYIKVRRGKTMAAETAFAYARRIGVKVDNTSELIEKINNGLAYRTFEELQRDLGVPAKELAEVVQIAPRTLTRRKTAGKFLPDESDRILRTSRVFERVLELFEGDHEAARRWITSATRTLNGSSPLHFSVTEVGAREVENLIGRLERGVFA